MFRIIGIETLSPPENEYKTTDGMEREQKMTISIRKARYHSVMKVLKPNQTYWFYGGYEKTEEGSFYRLPSATPDNFFQCGNVNVSVSAIVAENGMGKSSLFELCFRIINNVAYALRDGLTGHKSHLCFVRDIYARVIYEYDGTFYTIEQRDEIIVYNDQTHPENNWSFDFNNPPTENIQDAAKKRLKGLFYTIVINYSQYAYNANDYMAEWDETNYDNDDSYKDICWITSLFHKNDAYQTPIVLNPFRENGNIDVNVERDLTHKRLFQLVIKNPQILNKILRNKHARSLIFDVDENLNPVSGHRFSSLKVLQIMQKMHIIPSIKSGIASREVLNIGKRILASWGHLLGYYIEPKKSDEYWSDMDVVRTLNYIVYKTLKISITYPQYFKFRDCFDDKGAVQEYTYNLYKDNSHITLKIRRCLSYLNFKHYSTGHQAGERFIGNEYSFERFHDILDYCIENTESVYNQMITDRPMKLYGVDDYNVFYWNLDELLPAPSFKADIILEDNAQNLIRFSSLSSGEKQMIYSMCTIIYHLKNLDSVWENGAQEAVKYKNINLVFDEIELYSHPKFQQMFIDMLLNSIQSMNFAGIHNVNILLATHSPFILSDLPISNILCIRDGASVQHEERVRNTFCANVYDILNCQFFMNKFIGDFASKKLNVLVGKIKEYRDRPTEEQREDILSEIGFYGDDFLRMKLMKAMEL